MIAKKTYKNQLTLPKDVIKGLEDVTYFDASRRGNEIILRPLHVEERGAFLNQIRAQIKALGLTEDVVEEAVRWARKR